MTPYFTTALPITGALQRAHADSGLSYSEVRDRLVELGVPTSKALVGQIVKYEVATRLERAEALAEIYKQPVGLLFTHPNGDPIGGM